MTRTRVTFLWYLPLLFELAMLYGECPGQDVALGELKAMIEGDNVASIMNYRVVVPEEHVTFIVDFSQWPVIDDVEDLDALSQLKVLMRIDGARRFAPITEDGHRRVLVVVSQPKIIRIDVTIADQEKAIAELKKRLSSNLDGMVLTTGAIRLYGTVEEIKKFLKKVLPVDDS